MNLDTLTQQFQIAGQHYNAAIQPYALHLFFLLFTIDLCVTWLQFAIEGSLDPVHYMGRFFRQVMAGGFTLLMIAKGFDWMTLVINSFATIGQNLTGLPFLSPSGIMHQGIAITERLFNSPTAYGLLSSVELALAETVLSFLVLFSFAIIAIEMILLLVKFYFTVGLGVILLALGGNSFTSRLTGTYFEHVLRVGIKLLFLYCTLGVGMTMVNQFSSALIASCHAAPTAVPFVTSYFVPPSKIIVNMCTQTIPVHDMISFAIYAVVFAALCVAVPMMAADLVGGSIGMGLAHFLEAAVLIRTARGMLAPVTNSLRTIATNTAGLAKPQNPAMSNASIQQAALRAHARQNSNATAATQPLSPGSATPGYNVRPNGGAGTASAAPGPGNPATTSISGMPRPTTALPGTARGTGSV